MSGTSTTTKITVAIAPDPGFTLVLNSLSGTEELGRPFLYELLMSSTDTKADLVSVLGSSVTVTVVQPDGSTRYFNGVIGRIAYAGMRGGARSYRIELRPWLWLLSHRRDCRIFQNQSPHDIITSLCKAAGFSDYDDSGWTKLGLDPLEYCVQYDESTFDFITRLMEQYGIYYYYTHASGKHTVMFCDDLSAHASIGAAIPFRTQQTRGRAVTDHVWQWSAELAVVPGQVTFQDYNFTTSGTDLTARTSKPPNPTHNYGDFEVFEYPGLYTDVTGGQGLTGVRAEDHAARRQIMFGTSNSRLITTGCKFTLSEFYEESQNTDYTVVRATYTLAVGQVRAKTAGASRDTFRCVFECINAATQFRLRRITPRPLIRGPQTAKVVGDPTGSASDEIVTDQYGRVKVLFYWARPTTPSTQTATQQNAQKASCWIRVAQIWAGAGWGGIFIPRINQEVVVEFLEGNPDRPIITGCVYNDVQTVPYPLDANKTRSTIKTNSSTGGNGFNELRFEDKAGSEEVFFQAQKDYNKVVLHSETVNITQDTTTTVKQGNRSVTVSQGNNSATVSQGDNSLTVSTGKNTTTVQSDNSLTVNQGNNSVTVSTGNDSLTVSTGNHSITVSAGSSTISAGQSITIKANDSITLQVGSNSIAISTSGITISAAQISAKADASMSLDGGGAMTLKAGAIAIN
ncbi:MAG TPA: type VI secretion system tip protein TssI/VgrG [Acetobacteraceae bacterium]|nr:type VI secretion system tip protein TssI/VgrG [Acetobacteraceae bacterium]